MLVSYNWLNEYIDLHDTDVNEIAHRLTFAGVEVEEIKKLSDATNLVVGLVKECELVEGTHLHICKVDLGNKYGIRQIICGAPNVRKDLKVIVALPGAKLPGGEIRVSTIRGFESNGMCCSLLELGVDPKFVDEVDKTGIHELSDDFDIGETDVLNKLGLDDIIFNLKLLANRPDLMSLYNVAKEIATLFNKKIKPLKIENLKGNKINFKVSSETNKCKQFSIRIVKGIKVKESPIELKKYLISMGVRPINNIVDIGNYIMLLTGQPLHMYDFDKLPKKELIVKDNLECDFKALDNNVYKINKGDLVVTSNNKAMCLAGVMGGLESSDSITTENVVIEAANFDGASIRRTSVRLNLGSESSNRFIHGINPSQYDDVVNLTTSLIKKYCGLSSVSEIITYDCFNHKEKRIHLSKDKINNILGTNYSINEMLEVLKKDNFVIKNKKLNEADIIVPNSRIDIDGINDLAEEIIRALGFNDVKNELPRLTSMPGLLNDNQKKINAIKNGLSNTLYEVYSYVLVNKKRSSEFTYLVKDKPYKLLNPMTDDHEYVRTSLTPSLLDIVSYNLAHQNKDFGIYEISDINVNGRKEIHLGIALTGSRLIQNELSKVEYSFYSLKGYFEQIMSLLGIEGSRYQLKNWEFGGNELHPTRSASVYISKNLVAYLGELHPNAYFNYSIKNNKVLVMEINLSVLLNLPLGNIKFKPIPRFPTVTRDLALLLNIEVHSDFVLSTIKKCGCSLIKDVSVFDIYYDDSLKGKKSIAVKITLGKDDGTLKDEETNEAMEKIRLSLLKENITIR